VTAPSTHIRARYGFVFDDCDFTHDDSAAARRGRFLLGRQWFEGVRATPYGASPVEGFRCRLGPVSEFAPPDGAISRATLEAVGKCVVLNSRIGPHINPAAPWGEWNGGEWSAIARRLGTRGSGPSRRAPATFLAELGHWLREQGLDYADLDASEAWLGEHRNVWAGAG
jgi:pectinesterase